MNNMAISLCKIAFKEIENITNIQMPKEAMAAIIGVKFQTANEIYGEQSLPLKKYWDSLLGPDSAKRWRSVTEVPALSESAGQRALQPGYHSILKPIDDIKIFQKFIRTQADLAAYDGVYYQLHKYCRTDKKYVDGWVKATAGSFRCPLARKKRGHAIYYTLNEIPKMRQLTPEELNQYVNGDLNLNEEAVLRQHGKVANADDALRSLFTWLRIPRGNQYVDIPTEMSDVTIPIAFNKEAILSEVRPGMDIDEVLEVAFRHAHYTHGVEEVVSAGGAQHKRVNVPSNYMLGKNNKNKIPLLSAEVSPKAQRGVEEGKKPKRLFDGNDSEIHYTQEGGVVRYGDIHFPLIAEYDTVTDKYQTTNRGNFISEKCARAFIPQYNRLCNSNEGFDMAQSNAVLAGENPYDILGIREDASYREAHKKYQEVMRNPNTTDEQRNKIRAAYHHAFGLKPSDAITPEVPISGNFNGAKWKSTFSSKKPEYWGSTGTARTEWASKKVLNEYYAAHPERLVEVENLRDVIYGGHEVFADQARTEVYMNDPSPEIREISRKTEKFNDWVQEQLDLATPETYTGAHKEFCFKIDHHGDKKPFNAAKKYIFREGEKIQPKIYDVIIAPALTLYKDAATGIERTRAGFFAGYGIVHEDAAVTPAPLVPRDNDVASDDAEGKTALTRLKSAYLGCGYYKTLQDAYEAVQKLIAVDLKQPYKTRHSGITLTNQEKITSHDPDKNVFVLNRNYTNDELERSKLRFAAFCSMSRQEWDAYVAANPTVAPTIQTMFGLKPGQAPSETMTSLKINMVLDEGRRPAENKEISITPDTILQEIGVSPASLIQAFTENPNAAADAIKDAARLREFGDQARVEELKRQDEQSIEYSNGLLNKVNKKQAEEDTRPMSADPISGGEEIAAVNIVVPEADIADSRDDEQHKTQKIENSIANDEPLPAPEVPIIKETITEKEDEVEIKDIKDLGELTEEVKEEPGIKLDVPEIPTAKEPEKPTPEKEFEEIPTGEPGIKLGVPETPTIEEPKKDFIETPTGTTPEITEPQIQFGVPEEPSEKLVETPVGKQEQSAPATQAPIQMGIPEPVPPQKPAPTAQPTQPSQTTAPQQTVPPKKIKKVKTPKTPKSETLEQLVKLADTYDKMGKKEIANKIDKAIQKISRE